MINTSHFFITCLVTIIFLFNSSAKASEFVSSEVKLTNKKTGKHLGQFMGKCNVGLEEHNQLKITCLGSTGSEREHYLIQGVSNLNYEMVSKTTELNSGETRSPSSVIYSNAMVTLRGPRTIYIYFHEIDF